MANLGERTFGPDGRRLADLTDEELAAEVRRRRAARTGPAPSTPSPSRQPAGSTALKVRQWYANLELPEGAGPDEVEAAYERLVRRYDPDRHRGDPQRHRAALELTRSLTRAYRGLIATLRR